MPSYDLADTDAPASKRTMTPEQAADARRSKKEELERQLAALDEEDR